MSLVLPSKLVKGPNGQLMSSIIHTPQDEARIDANKAVIMNMPVPSHLTKNEHRLVQGWHIQCVIRLQSDRQIPLEHRRVPPMFGKSDLHNAIRNFDSLDNIRRLVTPSTLDSLDDVTGATPLITAFISIRKENFDAKNPMTSIMFENTDDIPKTLSALKKHQSAVVDLLLSLGANPNQPGVEKVFPLDMASQLSMPDMVFKLLDAGADPNYQAKDLDVIPLAALISLCQRGMYSKEITTLMLEFGGDVHKMFMLQGKKTCVYDLALRHGYAEILRLMKLKYEKRLPSNVFGTRKMLEFPEVVAQAKLIVCANCSAPATAEKKLLLCKGCGEVRYCDMTCATSHWKQHKAACGGKKT